MWTILSFISNILFKFSRFIFIFTSLTAIVVAYFVRINIWDFPAFFVIPTGTLCIGALGLYLQDMNFPLWKSIYVSFIFPILSGISIIFIL